MKIKQIKNFLIFILGMAFTTLVRSDDEENNKRNNINEFAGKKIFYF